MNYEIKVIKRFIVAFTKKILKLKNEEHKKISLLFIQCTKKIVYVDQSNHDRSPKHIHPNRISAIKDMISHLKLER